MRKLIVPLLCASLLAPSLPSASANALPLAKAAVAADSDVTLARWGRGPGPLGIFGAIVAGTLVAAAITEHRARREDMAHCAADFRSFDPRSGTIIDRYGRERVCPYLY
jgi:BA14K-like protein